MFFKKKEYLYAVCDGKLENITEVNDSVFSSGMVGYGYKISPTSNLILSPINGVISVVFPTKHAFGITAKKLDVLIHIGLDTVELNGMGIEALVKPGDKVKVGEALAIVDFKFIREKGYPDDVIVCSSQITKDLELKSKLVKAKDEVYSLE